MTMTNKPKLEAKPRQVVQVHIKDSSVKQNIFIQAIPVAHLNGLLVDAVNEVAHGLQEL